jgi:aspartate 1-decarboxylase
MYLHIQFNGIVSALLDTGSSIILMSYILYNSLSNKYKSELLTVTNNKIVLVNNHKMQTDGIGTIITGIIEGNQTSFHL